MSLAASLASQAAVALRTAGCSRTSRRSSRASCSHRSPRSSRATRPPLATRCGWPSSRRGSRRRSTARIDAPFRDVRFSADEMREIRYASLLHDFGKVGVREEVLVKAKKLFPHHLEPITQRVELHPARRRAARGRQEARPAARAGAAPPLDQLGRCDAELTACSGAGRAFRRGGRGQRALGDAARTSRRGSSACRWPASWTTSGRSVTVITEDEARIALDPAGQPDRGGVQADPVPRGPHLPVPGSDPVDARAPEHSGDRPLASRKAQRLRLPGRRAARRYPDRVAHDDDHRHLRRAYRHGPPVQDRRARGLPRSTSSGPSARSGAIDSGAVRPVPRAAKPWAAPRAGGGQRAAARPRRAITR